MDKFKFDEKERDELYDLMGVLNHSKKIATLDRIETLISFRADGWVIGQHVYHTDVYNGRELMKIVGIRENEVELEGDYSGGTHNVCQRGWESKSGLITQ